MSLLTKIKAGLALIVFLIIGGLSAMLKIRTSQKEKAETERDIAESKASSSQKRVEAHEKLRNHENKIKSSIEKSRNDDVNTIADRMRKKANHRNGTGD